MKDLRELVNEKPDLFVEGWFTDQALAGRRTQIVLPSRGLPAVPPGSSMEVETSFMQQS